MMLSLSAAAAATDESAEAQLTRTITALDRKVFDAYNQCDLETFTHYFVPDVEFYHDKGGVTFDRASVVENTRKYICHKVRRELLPASLKVYPIKDYGAIEEGEHRFCELASGKCEGSARFLMIWQHKDGEWRMTRVVSYGHRALTDEEKAALAPKPGG
ncbi:nuclear transport factor 2 family protein [Dyella sp. OK004]|uniref:nuclear transport factor 2 family protein n=1 Tax=Dyella sp. OK004 TaxID=1855292 RepID=UPI000B89C9CE|nr:nuclear transport factor 2 family protein [Dyella sp. OK004]